jgi:hypothetical protein
LTRRSLKAFSITDTELNVKLRSGGDESWLACGQCSSLVDDKRRNFLESFERFRVPNQDAGLGAATRSRP